MQMQQYLESPLHTALATDAIVFVRPVVLFPFLGSWASSRLSEESFESLIGDKCLHNHVENLTIPHHTRPVFFAED